MQQDSSIEKTLLQGTIIVILIGILAKFASFISEAILAAYLGTTYQSDAYYMVTSIQQVIYPMLSVGIWKIFLPIYKEKITKEEYNKADTIANKFTTFTTLLSLVAILLLMVFSDIVVGIVAPGFTGRTKELCSQLVRISAPMYVFIIAAAIYSSMLQCYNKFLGSQIREIASHIPTIVVALFCYEKWGVKALAIALVIGGFFRLIVELPFVDWGYRYKPDFRFNDPELKIMFKRLPSALISEGVNQINILIDKVMASSLPEGAVSSLNYGNKLTTVFSGLLSTAISTALYPQVIELVTLNKNKELSKLMTRIINIFALLMIPVTLACILFSSPLVSAVYERGAFNTNSVSMTSSVFGCYCIGLFFIACNTVLTNIFYAFGDTKTPMYISIENLVFNVIGNLVFIYLFGVKGLALSTSLSAIIAFFVRVKYVRKYIQFDWKTVSCLIVRIVIASIISCVIPVIIVKRLIINVYIELLIAATIGIPLYLICIKLFKVDELDYLLKLISEKIKK